MKNEKLADVAILFVVLFVSYDVFLYMYGGNRWFYSVSMKGVVIFVSSGIAHIYTPDSPVELLLDLRTTARRISVGEWLECSPYKSYVEWFKRIESRLPTKVVDGKVQLETRVRVDYDEVTIESEHFGKVAFLGARPPLKMGHVYKCNVQRDPEQYSTIYSNLGVKWHVISSTIVEVGDVQMLRNPSWVKPSSFQRVIQPPQQNTPDVNQSHITNLTNQLQQTYLAVSIHTGVIVGRRGRYYIIYCKAGFVQMTERWKREATPLEVGQWIQFKSKKIADKRHIVDSNSWREVPPLHITKVDDKGRVVLTVPCSVRNEKVHCYFLPDVTGTPCTERIRTCRAVAYADEKNRFRWKMIDKLPTVVTSTSVSEVFDKKRNTEEVTGKSQDFSQDVDLAWKRENMESTSLLAQGIG